ncbi:DUF1877 family protein [Hymenobacter arizonensis]|uniref:DUF1877 family protein n=1 Tax=Hymenobacter arizonensis TaxID=1227077 RepID=A0A1I6BN25_HYMAR|nr:DUF1877 family protein [Hymenobacter arizonensis]SFQ82349.1 protein of unknown function [Hymenobacter arizonensis]
MGLSAVLHSLDKRTFDQLAADPASFKYYRVAVASASFDKTFEGLQFVLCKAKPAAADLLSRLFYPLLFVGEELDYAHLDWDNLPPDAPLDGTAVYYHDPATVQALATHVATITDPDVRHAFDPDELNREGIYPEIWNREADANNGFNEHALVEEFHYLQQFLAQASAGGHYCVCYVG